ncbi:glycogen/starch/alpha-glucan phosphorylase, partial [Desulfosarcina sp.]|uniref:glycogen/starch/alpha-glucan phosphorylase n=1 Tax=Desulfosarcina sp. TaxID=2027861 RepID=UPI003970A357
MPRKIKPAKSQPPDHSFDDSAEAIRKEIIEKLFSMRAKFPEVATLNDYYLALAYVIRDRVLHRYIHSAQTYFEKESRTVLYLSAEYLMGPQLGNNLISLGLYDETARAVESLGMSLEAVMQQEEEPGLGNGGLGRLAACYMDSLATLQIPAIGYGIRYEFGIFDQAIKDGWQVELSDKWLRFGNPWETAHPEIRFEVKFGGHTESFTDEKGRYRARWIPEHLVLGVPHDTPVLGYGVNNANFLRLWCARACESFDFQAFNVGNYYKAVEQKMVSENITKVLYPNDQPEVGRRLRLQQQAFFVSCSLQDMIRLFLQRESDLTKIPDKFVAQLNDTHPALAVAELMRLLVDEHFMEWEPAWTITTRVFAYTNHTLLPEALETWSVPLMRQLLPRHLEIIFEINRRFLDDVVRVHTRDEETIARLSLIAESGEKQVRMANLACVGSHAINGVAKLHTDLLKQTVLKDFHALWPEKLKNVTNGVTPRRFMVLANPGQTRLICETIGDKWIRDLDLLADLEPFADDPEFRRRWNGIQRACKERLAHMILKTTGISIDPDSLFDVQVKRIHEYKRQHLNLLHILTRYHRIKQGLATDAPPRTFIFGGKAAPGYTMALLIIRLIHAVAEVVNHDPEVNDRLKVVFYPDFNVKNAQVIYPAADLSEQISTAGKEASGTGNMKFSLNGALTIGTLDGANVEIREAVGPENFFLFGLTADQVVKTRQEGYWPMDLYHRHQELRAVIDTISSGALFPADPSLFRPLVDSLLYQDLFMVLADYDAYVRCQETVDRRFKAQDDWQRMSILNTARMGRFSSDRSIAEYCREIWGAQPV